MSDFSTLFNIPSGSFVPPPSGFPENPPREILPVGVADRESYEQLIRDIPARVRDHSVHSPAPSAAPASSPTTPKRSSTESAAYMPETKAHGVFNSVQAVVVFPAASTLILVVWRVLGKVFPSWGTNITVPFYLALLVGVSLFAVSKSDAKSWSEKWVGFFFALLNSCTLAATALGIDTVAK